MTNEAKLRSSSSATLTARLRRLAGNLIVMGTTSSWGISSASFRRRGIVVVIVILTIVDHLPLMRNYDGALTHQYGVEYGAWQLNYGDGMA